ncbi:MAG TPA: VCBS repeat-containing protein, partial [Gemmataceae bacterium]|nr:VCBS repeat-containing protein [Gemmataceae bacterium]
MRHLSVASLLMLTATLARGQDISFKTQEIETKLGVGYAVLLVDVDGDGKPDIVVVDQKRVVWFKNPTWQRKTIIEGGTSADNVCIAAADIDGDG